MPQKAEAVPDLDTATVAADCDVTQQTVSRWITDGVDGVKLKAKMIGRSWRTTQADLDEFFRRLTEAALSK